MANQNPEPTILTASDYGKQVDEDGLVSHDSETENENVLC